MSLPSHHSLKDSARVYFMCGESLSRPYTAWTEQCDCDTVHTEIISNKCRQWEVPADALMVITYEHYELRGVDVLQQCKKRGIASLVLVDGILEYRNTWLRPSGVPGSIFQPVLGDKIACIGRSQARLLESWGNVGKCEVVGLPRFDSLLHRQPRVRSSAEPWTPLILTAKTPGFTPEQIDCTRQSLADLKAWFDVHPSLGGVPIRPRWRITAGMGEAIGVPNELRDTSGEDLAYVLEQVDAVITTPSTTMLEGMLQGVPVALLDYHNAPHFVPAAWTISARDHIEQVLPELVHPPEPKLLYQQTMLHDALECHTPATPRLAELVESMIRIARDCHERGEAVSFPDRLLDDPQHEHHLPEERFDLIKLYPGHTIFENLDRAALQLEVGHCWQRVRAMEEELARVRGAKVRSEQILQQQVQELEASLSFRLGRAMSWPFRTLARFAR